MNDRRESPEASPTTEGPDIGKKKSSISRRNFLRISVIAIGSVLVACQKLFKTPEPTKAQPTTTVEPTATLTPTSPVEITPLPQSFQSIRLNLEYLLTEGAKIASGDANLAPDPVLVAPEQQKGANPDQLNPIDFTTKAFHLTNIDFLEPLHVLKYAIAQGVRMGTSGGVTHFQSGGEDSRAFAGLAIFRGILDGGTNGEHTVQEGYPRGLVIRKGSGLSIVGRASNGGDIVIAFEEYINRSGHEFSPRMRLAVVPPREFRNISQRFMLKANYDPQDTPDKITYDSTTLEINSIDYEMINLIKVDAGVVWVERYADPNSETGYSFHPEPVVPYPPDELLVSLGISKDQALSFAQGLEYKVIESKFDLGNPRCMMVWAKVGNGKPILVARYWPDRHEWDWHPQTFHEILNHKGRTLGVNIDNSVDMNRDAQLIVDNFNMIIPGYFSWGWIRRNGPDVNTIDLAAADNWVDFAQENGMRVSNGNPLVYNVNLPDWFTQGKFTDEELKNILIEHIKAVVNYFKGKVSVLRPIFWTQKWRL